MTKPTPNPIFHDPPSITPVSDLDYIDLVPATEPKPAPIRTTALRLSVQQFIVFKRACGVKEDTLSQWTRVLWEFVDYAGGRIVDSPLIDEWFTALSLRISQPTIAKNRRILTVFFAYLFRHGRVSHNPVTCAKLGKDKANKKRVAIITRKQYETIRDKLTGTEWRSMVVLAWNTGLRKSDMLNLKWSNVDFDRSVIELSPIKTSRFKSRICIPIVPGSELAELLTALHEERAGEYVLQSLRCKTSRRVTVFFCKRLRQWFPGRGITLHSFRRSFITNLISSGVEARIVTQIAGVSKGTIDSYWVPNEDACRTAMERMVTLVERGIRYGNPET